MESKRKILYYNKFWGNDSPDFTRLNIPDFEIITEKDYKYLALAGQADVSVIIFHIPSLELRDDELITLKQKNHLWVFWSMEGAVHFPRFERPEIKELFDIRVTYQYSADIPIPYINFQDDTWRQEPLPKTGFIAGHFADARDQSGRYRYLLELKQHLDVHLYGKVFDGNRLVNSSPFSKKIEDRDNNDWRSMLSKYKFTLVFEDSIATDFVTERFFESLKAGSVPVYLGAPNVADFAPAENSYISVNSFSSPKELAEYLLHLNQNQELYNELLTWKRRPFKMEFQEKIDHKTDPLQTLLTIVRQKLSHV